MAAFLMGCFIAWLSVTLAFRPGFEDCATSCVKSYQLFVETAESCATALYYQCHYKCFSQYGD